MICFASLILDDILLAMSEHQNKSMGKGMIITAWIIALGMLTLFFNKVLEKQYNPNQSLQSSINASGIREIKLLRNRGGHYVTPGEINQQKVVFMLDTGATTISIPAGIAKNIGLKKGYAFNVSTANGTIQVYSTRLQQVKMGDITLDDVSANINPYMEGEEILMGMNVLKKLEMIQRGDTLTLRQHP